MYRLRATGEIKSQDEIRRMHTRASLPLVWSKSVCEELGVDPVFESPQPEITRYQTAARVGVEQDANGNWVWVWSVVDMDENGVAQVDAAQASNVRATRDRRLVESDWTQILDAPVDRTVWASYREALRRLPEQEGFPHNVVWPTKPE